MKLSEQGQAPTQPSCVKPYSNMIPRRRKPNAQPIPRWIVGTRPLITLDPQSLSETADAFGVSVQDGARCIPRLKARNAIAASENARSLWLQTEERMAVESAKAQTKLMELEPKCEALAARLEICQAELASLLAPLGLGPVDGRCDLQFQEGEPLTLEELAGKHDLPPPEEHVGWWVRAGYRLLAALGGGTVFGVSLGLLTGKLELYSFEAEWPWMLFWAILGSSVMCLAGASLYPLARSLGDQLYRKGVRLQWVQMLQALLNFMLLIGLVVSLTLIESKVEQLGLFKALGEQSSLKGFRISQGDLFWVSLMLVVPTLASYVVCGLREGERLANLARLKAMRSDLREEIRSRPTFSLVCAQFERIRALSARKEEIEAQIALQKALIRSEPTAQEKERQEDMEMDAALASYDAEDYLLGLCREGEGSSYRKRKPWNWLRGLLGGPRRQLG